MSKTVEEIEQAHQARRALLAQVDHLQELLEDWEAEFKEPHRCEIIRGFRANLLVQERAKLSAARLQLHQLGPMLCGAKTRGGAPCQRFAVTDRRRCRLHGGCSSGPRTEAGKARIRASNRARAPRSTGRARSIGIIS